MSAIRDVMRRAYPRAARLGEALGRLVYPPHCLVCRRPTEEDEDRYLCRDCIGTVRFVSDPTCPKCGHELGPHTAAGPRCVNCRNMPLRFERAVAAAHHTGAARHMVLALKFAGQKYQAFPLSKLLAARLNDTDIPGKVQLIVPVPLHRGRLRSRGFDQAELLATELGERLRLPVATNIIRRIVNTPPQTRATSRAGRRANVKGAFRVRRFAGLIRGKSLLLIDDVLTTGATTSECAGTLKRAGARRVYVATVTRRMTTPPGAHDGPDRHGDAAESSPPACGVENRL